MNRFIRQGELQPHNKAQQCNLLLGLSAVLAGNPTISVGWQCNKYSNNKSVFAALFGSNMGLEVGLRERPNLVERRSPGFLALGNISHVIEQSLLEFELALERIILANDLL